MGMDALVYLCCPRGFVDSTNVRSELTVLKAHDKEYASVASP